MSHINNLPIELLTYILSFLVPDGLCQWDCPEPHIEGKEKTGLDRDDERDGCIYASLYNSCLVSKKFSAIAQPFLFSNFVDDGIPRCREHTVRFAKCLYQNPELGIFVQHITVEGAHDLDPLERSELPKEDLEFFSQAIKSLNLGNEEESDWISYTKFFDISIVTTLIINKTINLRRLTIPGGITSMTFAERLLSKLDAIWIRKKYGWTVLYYCMASYDNFLRLPSLKLAIFESGYNMRLGIPPIWEPGTLSIRKLVFHGCEIDSESIKSLTIGCEKLKAFSFDGFVAEADPEVDSENEEDNQFNAADIHEALSAHKDTLEILSLKFPRHFIDLRDWKEFLTRSVKIPSLRKLSMLRKVSLDQAIIPVHPQFPNSLTSLVVSNCNSSVVDLVKTIAGDYKEGFCPGLVDFQIWAVDIKLAISDQTIPGDQTQEQMEKALVDLFLGRNVYFRSRQQHICRSKEVMYD